MNPISKVSRIHVKRAGLSALAGILLLVSFATTGEAQPAYSANGGTVTITSFSGAEGALIIPSTVDGLAVTGIGNNAFQNASNLTSVEIPDSIVTIGDGAFFGCVNLTDVTIGNEVTAVGAFPIGSESGLVGFTISNSVSPLGEGVFSLSALTNVTVPDGITNLGASSFYIYFARSTGGAVDSCVTIGTGAFASCVKLANIRILKPVAAIGNAAFYFCTSLTEIRFIGDAPSEGTNIFGLVNATVYYVPGTTGWSTNFGFLPTAEWTPSHPMIMSSSPTFGLRNNEFGFTVAGADGASVSVQACTNLATPSWMPVSTVRLSGGAAYFSDPDPPRDSIRFYRLAAP